jgi:hypothetical protein
MDLFLAEFDLFSAAPHNDLLTHIVAAAPSAVEAYVLANVGHQYAVYFPRGRFMVGLDPWTYVKKARVRWLNIEALAWTEPETIEVKWVGGRNEWGDRGQITLKTPGNEAYVALVDLVSDDALFKMELLN